MLELITSTDSARFGPSVLLMNVHSSLKAPASAILLYALIKFQVFIPFLSAFLSVGCVLNQFSADMIGLFA